MWTVLGWISLALGLAFFANGIRMSSGARRAAERQIRPDHREAA